MVSYTEGSESLSFEVSHHDVGAARIPNSSVVPWRQTDFPVQRDAEECHCHQATRMSKFKMSLLLCVFRLRVKAGASLWPPHPWGSAAGGQSELLVSGVGGKTRLLRRLKPWQTPQPWKGVRCRTDKTKNKCPLSLLRDTSSTLSKTGSFPLTHATLLSPDSCQHHTVLSNQQIYVFLILKKKKKFILQK